MAAQKLEPVFVHPEANEIVLLLERAGGTDSQGRIAEGAVRSLEELVRHLQGAEAKRFVGGLAMVLDVPLSESFLRKARLDKYLRDEVAVPAHRARAAVLRLVGHLVAHPRGRAFESYVVHPNHEKRDQALAALREMLGGGDPPDGDAPVATPSAPPADCPPAAAPAAATHALAPSDIAPPLVLWVDDHPANNEQEARVAREAGVTVVQVRSTAEAERFLEANSRRLGMWGPNQFRIVSDRHRIEERDASGEAREDPDAVFRLWNLVRLEHYMLETPMLIYTSQHGAQVVEEKLLPSMAIRNVADRFLRVTASPRVCMPFVTMQPLPPAA